VRAEKTGVFDTGPFPAIVPHLEQDVEVVALVHKNCNCGEHMMSLVLCVVLLVLHSQKWKSSATDAAEED